MCNYTEQGAVPMCEDTNDGHESQGGSAEEGSARAGKSRSPHASCIGLHCGLHCGLQCTARVASHASYVGTRVRC